MYYKISINQKLSIKTIESFLLRLSEFIFHSQVYLAQKHPFPISQTYSRLTASMILYFMSMDFTIYSSTVSTDFSLSRRPRRRKIQIIKEKKARVDEKFSKIKNSVDVTSTRSTKLPNFFILKIFQNEKRLPEEIPQEPQKP